MFLTHLECPPFVLRNEWARLQNVCAKCHKPRFSIVDRVAIRKLDCFKQSSLQRREKSLWRYREVLPLPANVEPVSLGEGGTPLLRTKKFGEDVDLWIKDESLT